MITQITISKKEIISVLLGMIVLVFGYLMISKNLYSGPRIADENQIFKLQIELQEDGFFLTLKNEITSRLGMKRLVPVYNIQKIFFAKFFGPNMFLWSSYSGLLGALSGLLLYVFGRRIGFSITTSLVFSLITILGEQSALWWRILHGEGIGLVLFSLGLCLLAPNRASLKSQIGSVLCFTLAALSKESFILALPAAVLMKVSLPFIIGERPSFKELIKTNIVYSSSLAVICMALILIIKLGLGTTSFQYTGWVGFDMDKFVAIVGQYSATTNFLLVVGILFGGLVIQNFFLKKSSQWSLNVFAVNLGPAIIFFLLLTTPQLLLYMSSGFENNGSEANYERYLIPCLLGYSFLVASIVHLQEEFNSYKIIYYLILLVPAIHTYTKSGIALDRAIEYEKNTAVNEQWFRSVVDNVSKDDNVVVSFLNGARGGYSLQAALRVYYILNQGYGLTNVYFSPFPEKPTIEETKEHIVQNDTRRHVGLLKLDKEIEDKNSVKAVMVLNWGKVVTNNPNEKLIVSNLLEMKFMEKNSSWINEKTYVRIPNDNKHISYIKKR